MSAALNASPERQVLKASRPGILLAGLACVLAAFLGIWFMGQTDDAVMIAWSGIGVFVLGAAALLALYQLWRPVRVILTPDGFAVTGLVRTGVVPWREGEAFLVYEEPMTEDGGVPPHAAWRLRDRSAAAEGLATRLNRAGGLPIDGSLPRNLGLSPEALVALLESWRARYGGL